MKLELIRLVVVYFRAKLEAFSLTHGDVRVDTIYRSETNGQTKVLLAGRHTLETLPSVVGDRIVVPNEPRKKIEQVIEVAANLFSVGERCQRLIRSSIPHVALVACDDEAAQWLTDFRGFTAKPQSVASQRFPIQIQSVLSQLLDRIDGVALLAEAFAHEHVTGRFHECLRVFERAFHRSSTALVDPMADFLCETPFEFSKDEIRDWVVNKRHPATHADIRDFILEADIQPIIRRVEDAAMDVLFNKVDWRSPSHFRRSCWTPEGGTLPTGVWVYQHTASGALTQQMFDMFQSYPLDPTSCIPNLPQGFWSPMDAGADGSNTVAGEASVLKVIARPVS